MTNPSLNRSPTAAAAEEAFEVTAASPLEATELPGQTLGSSTVLSAGSTLGPYQILQKLGEGGMGAVYKAQHVKLDKTVAIKVLSAAVTNQPAAVARFEREMKAVGKLNHPNIVQAHDAGEINGTHYLAMEYIDGTDLMKLVKDRGPMTVVNACKVIRQSALALAAAHKAGMVHRDIKPSNLLVAKNGQIKLLDLGLALLGGEASSQTSDITTAGQTFGTPDYMAPEQWEDAHSADARTDLYALGCTLHFLLTGKAPYGNDTHKTAVNKMKGHVLEAVPDLKAAREEIPEEVAAIYQKLLAKKPAERFQSGTELAEVLAPFASSKPAATAPVANSPVAPTQPLTIDVTAPPPVAPPYTTHGSRADVPRRFGLIAGGAAALVELLGVIVITITNKDGKKTTIKVPEGIETDVVAAPGSRVSITQSDNSIKSPATEVTAASTGWHGWPADAPKPAIAPFDAAAAKAHQEAWAKHLGVPVEYTNSLGMKFRLIPPGEFTMGSTPEGVTKTLVVVPEDENWMTTIRSEAPQHPVILTQPFYLAVHEVTQADYQKIVGKNPSMFSATGQLKDAVVGLDTSLFPVELLGWTDAAEFCAVMSTREGFLPQYGRKNDSVTPRNGTGFRLPTEAEWEFACRAGTTSWYGTGDTAEDLTRVGWFQANSGSRTQVVGQLEANPFGLHDMLGNVWEWVEDGWDETLYARRAAQPSIDPLSSPSEFPLCVIRGGTFAWNAPFCRSAQRSAADNTSISTFYIGVRPALPVDAVRQAIQISTTKNTVPATSEADAAAERNFAIRLSPGVHVEMPSLSFDSAKPYTIEAWVTPLDASHTDKHVAGWTGPFSLFVSNAELNWSFGLSRDGAPFQFLLSPTPTVIDRRTHLAAVRTGREFRLFVDGQRVGNSQEHSAPLINQAEPFSLSSHSHPFSGDFDEVRVSRVARYDKNFTPKMRLMPDTDTLALYHCDENGGEQLVDSSSNKHHGKIIGKATWMGIGKAAANGNAPQPAIAPFDAAAAKAHQEAWAKHLGVPVEYTNSLGMKFRLIPPGEFTMGSTAEEIEAALEGITDQHWQACIQSSAPTHKVVLTQPMYWGEKEVTQDEYEQVVGTNPSRYSATGTGSAMVAGMPTNQHPVDSVNWLDAITFCTLLSQREQLPPCYFRSGLEVNLLEGTGYRLPTEAEWEFACRAGTTTKYWVGDKKEELMRVTWLAGNSKSHTHPVGLFEANPFGLYDLHGNVWEWVQDGWGAAWYSQFQETAAINPYRTFVGTSHRVVRGGAWGSAAGHCTSAIRDAYDPTMGDGLFGVRVVLSVDAVKTLLTIQPVNSGKPIP